MCFMILSTTLDSYDSDAMAREFLAQCHHMSFTIGQQLVFGFQEKKLLALIVKDLEGTFSFRLECPFDLLISVLICPL